MSATHHPARPVTYDAQGTATPLTPAAHALAPVSDPFGTFSAGGQHHGVTEWTVPDVNECEFRMLEPHEITAGMAFPKDYIMTGNKREQVKQAGNAVTPPAARDLIAIGAASLGVAR